MVDQNADGVVADVQQILFGGIVDAELLFLDDFVHGALQVGPIDLVHFQNVESRLQTFVHFLDIGANRDELNIFRVLVDIVAKYLLTLFVDGVDVVDDNDFFFIWNIGGRLAKSFHLGAEILDALFFQVVDEGDVVLGKDGGFVHAVIFADDGVDERGFAGAGVADDENIQVVEFLEGFENSDVGVLEIKVIDEIGAIF